MILFLLIYIPNLHNLSKSAKVRSLKKKTKKQLIHLYVKNIHSQFKFEPILASNKDISILSNGAHLGWTDNGRQTTPNRSAKMLIIILIQFKFEPILA